MKKIYSHKYVDPTQKLTTIGDVGILLAFVNWTLKSNQKDLKVLRGPLDSVFDSKKWLVKYNGWHGRRIVNIYYYWRSQDYF